MDSGDVVVLKSGGPMMTVESVEDMEQGELRWAEVKCSWFDSGGGVASRIFAPDALRVVSADTPDLRKQRFLDVMSVAWDTITAAEADRPGNHEATEASVCIDVRYKDPSFVIACHPIVPLTGEYDAFDPEHRKAKVVSEN